MEHPSPDSSTIWKSTWKQVLVLAYGTRVCHSTTGCKTVMNLNRLDFTLSLSSCRLCTSLYLSSHHTSAWEWLAFPQGHLIWSPCFIYTNTHTFIILLLYFPPRLAVHSVLVIRTRHKVLQYDYTIHTRSNAKSSH